MGERGAVGGGRRFRGERGSFLNHINQCYLEVQHCLVW